MRDLDTLAPKVQDGIRLPFGPVLAGPSGSECCVESQLISAWCFEVEQQLGHAEQPAHGPCNRAGACSGKDPDDGHRLVVPSALAESLAPRTGGSSAAA